MFVPLVGPEGSWRDERWKNQSKLRVPGSHDTHVRPLDVPVVEECNILANELVFGLLVLGLVLGLVFNLFRGLGRSDRGRRSTVGSGGGLSANGGDREGGNDGGGESHCVLLLFGKWLERTVVNVRVSKL